MYLKVKQVIYARFNVFDGEILSSVIAYYGNYLDYRLLDLMVFSFKVFDYVLEDLFEFLLKNLLVRISE
jgi:hypothetical protein